MKKILLLISIIAFILTGCGEKNDAEWTLTQYSDESGRQGNFYTLKSKEGILVIIDGGNIENAGYVERVIAENGNRVEAWILTHPHPDHIGAFVTLMEKGDMDFSVAAIYDNGIDYDAYSRVAQEWDEIGIFDRYRSLTEGWEEVKSLKKGDKLQFGTLSMQVFHAYYPGMENLVGDIPNNSSLVFRMSTDHTSMLFVGDCYDAGIAEKLLSEYKEALVSDYVQMAHHGNNTQPISFYQAVKPKGVFFDAPQWLIDQTERYDTAANMEKIKEFCPVIYDYRTCPNQVPF